MGNAKLIAEMTNHLLHDSLYFISLGFNVLPLICFKNEEMRAIKTTPSHVKSNFKTQWKYINKLSVVLC